MPDTRNAPVLIIDNNPDNATRLKIYIEENFALDAHVATSRRDADKHISDRNQADASPYQFVCIAGMIDLAPSERGPAIALALLQQGNMRMFCSSADNAPWAKVINRRNVTVINMLMDPDTRQWHWDLLAFKQAYTGRRAA